MGTEQRVVAQRGDSSSKASNKEEHLVESEGVKDVSKSTKCQHLPSCTSMKKSEINVRILMKI